MDKKTKNLLLLAGAGVAVYFLFFRDKKEVKGSLQVGDVTVDAGVDVDDKSESSFDDGFSNLTGAQRKWCADSSNHHFGSSGECRKAVRKAS
jgi:hypothetical protein